MQLATNATLSMVSGEDGLEGQQQPAQGNALGIMISPMYAIEGQKN